MDTSNYTIKVGFGKYNYLDKAYINLIRTQINNNESWIKRWEIYDMIIKEIIKLEDVTIFERLKYKVTGGENINQLLIDIMEHEMEPNLLIKSLIHKVEDFNDIDWLKDFCK
jgi:hypothetical protein